MAVNEKGVVDEPLVPLRSKGGSSTTETTAKTNRGSAVQLRVNSNVQLTQWIFVVALGSIIAKYSHSFTAYLTK